jgi:hypothetical protein
LTIIPILNGNKEVEELVSSIEDITDTYEEEKRRKDLEAVTNKINHILWIGETLNGNEEFFKYTFISDNILDIYGIEKQEAFNGNKLWLELVNDEHIEFVKDFLKLENFPRKIDYKINHSKKGVRWISSEVFKEGENKFYGIITDITEEKEREQKREAVLQALKASNNTMNIARIKNEKKEYIYAKSANKIFYKLPLSKIKHNPEVWKEFVHPENKEKQKRHIS